VSCRCASGKEKKNILHEKGGRGGQFTCLDLEDKKANSGEKSQYFSFREAPFRRVVPSEIWFSGEKAAGLLREREKRGCPAPYVEKRKGADSPQYTNTKERGLR